MLMKSIETLTEWSRVLKPYGLLYLSVPNLDVLARLFLDIENNSLAERFLLMRMMFGGHTTKHDYHSVGLNKEFLSYYLEKAGFADFKLVNEFYIFHDTNNLKFKNEFISINMAARKKQ